MADAQGFTAVGVSPEAPSTLKPFNLNPTRSRSFSYARSSFEPCTLLHRTEGSGASEGLDIASSHLEDTTGGEFGVYRASIRLL